MGVRKCRVKKKKMFKAPCFLGVGLLALASKSNFSQAAANVIRSGPLRFAVSGIGSFLAVLGPH